MAGREVQFTEENDAASSVTLSRNDAGVSQRIGLGGAHESADMTGNEVDKTRQDLSGNGSMAKSKVLAQPAARGLVLSEANLGRLGGPKPVNKGGFMADSLDSAKQQNLVTPRSRAMPTHSDRGLGDSPV